MTTLEALNKVIDGWTESYSGGMLVNSKNGDIIDCAIVAKDWFIIADFGSFDGFKTRDEAIEVYIAKINEATK